MLPLIPEHNAVTDSEHRDWVLLRLMSGWHPARVVQVLKEQKGVSLPVEAVDEVLAGLPPELLLPPSDLDKALMGLPVEADWWVETQRCILLAKQRLGDAMAMERFADQDGVTESGYPGPVDGQSLVAQRLKVLWTMLMELGKVLAMTGKSPVGEPVRKPSRESELPTLAELIQDSTKTTATQVTQQLVVERKD